MSRGTSSSTHYPTSVILTFTVPLAATIHTLNFGPASIVYVCDLNILVPVEDVTEESNPKYTSPSVGCIVITLLSSKGERPTYTSIAEVVIDKAPYVPGPSKGKNINLPYFRV